MYNYAVIQLNGVLILICTKTKAAIDLLIDLFKEAKQVILVSDKFPHPTPYTPTTPTTPHPICLTMVWSVHSHPRSHLEVCCVWGYLYKGVTGGLSPVSTLQLFT